MRHLKLKNKLGVGASHRKALLRNLVTALFEHGKIFTTLAKAKAMRKEVDGIITLMKKGDLHSRRIIGSYIFSKPLVYRLMNEDAKYFEGRNGGYTRIYRAASRRGDNAEMAYIELIKNDADEETESSNSSKKENLLKEVSEEVSKETPSESAEVVKLVTEEKNETREEPSKEKE